MKKMTIGEELVGVDFNPSNSCAIAELKKAAANLIDMVEEYSCDERTKAFAVKAIEEGAMWAVKSSTKSLS